MPAHDESSWTPLTADVPDPPRVAWRKEMRVRVLDAARDLTCDAGWDQVSLSAVAAHAQISRPTVYREFGNRAGLGRALVVRETREFLAEVAHALGPAGRDTRSSLASAIHFVLTEAEDNPLIRAVVEAARQGSDSLLPYLTARADPVFEGGQDLLRAWLADRFPRLPAEDIEIAADVTVRMTISHLVLPVWQPSLTAERVARAVLKVLGDG